jgi:hypothetical protein
LEDKFDCVSKDATIFGPARKKRKEIMEADLAVNVKFPAVRAILLRFPRAPANGKLNEHNYWFNRMPERRTGRHALTG